MSFTIIILASVYVLSFFIYKTIIYRKNLIKFGISKTIKNNFEKILIPTDKLNIYSNDYFEDEGSGIIEVESVDSLLGNKRNFEESEKYISIITYDFINNGKKYLLKSIPIDMSPFEIKNLLEKEKFVAVYFDKTDLAKHFFDLSTLAKKGN